MADPYATIAPLHGLVIAPGETFSFWRRVGRPTRKKGYVDGMQLSRGVAVPGVGGGICQVASVLHWLVLHSPLTVVERSATAPLFQNPTRDLYQIRLWLSERFLEAELAASAAPIHTYSIVEREHAFERSGGAVHRRNELWRRVCDRRTGAHVRDELIKRNHVRVMYPVAGLG